MKCECGGNIITPLCGHSMDVYCDKCFEFPSRLWLLDRAEEAERKIEDIKLLICLDYESVSNPIDAIKQIIKGV